MGFTYCDGIWILCWHLGNGVEGPNIDPLSTSAEDATHLRSGVWWVLPKLFRLNISMGSSGDSDSGPEGK